jgi:hypothetical protein
MGKKSRAKTGKEGSTPAKKGKSGKNNLWPILGGAAIMVAIVGVTVWNTSKDPATSAASKNTDPMSDEALKGPVNLVATLSPEHFTGRARASYRAAKEIPEILAQLPCFCGCMSSRELGHKNNLYCFADSHGNICELCQTIALEAKEMHRKGIPVETIRSNIRKTYGGSSRM